VDSATQAAILCGGRGERLRPLTDFFQKTMVPVGPKKRPLLEYIVRLVAHHGINRVALLTGYKSEEIEQYFGDGSHFGVSLTYSEDVAGRTGSLNAVANALQAGHIAGCKELLIYYGDVLSDLDITRLLSTHRSSGADATLVLARGYTLPVGVADVEDGKTVTSLREKPQLDVSVTTGCMVLGPNGMESVRRTAGPKKTDLMTHFVPQLLSGGGKVAAFYTEGIWFDVGTLTSFEKLNQEIRTHKLSFMP
jgi:mannose-1-phosphate guanylyltransferase